MESMAMSLHISLCPVSAGPYLAFFGMSRRAKLTCKHLSMIDVCPRCVLQRLPCELCPWCIQRRQNCIHKPTGPGHSSARSTWHMQETGSQTVQEVAVQASTLATFVQVPTAPKWPCRPAQG